MLNKEILKSYSVDIDFLDYEKKRDVTQKIVYSEGDVKTAYIYATLKMGEEVLNIEGHSITIGVKNSSGEYLVNGCEVVNAQEGQIKIPFTSSSLSRLGFNKFEVVLYKDEKKIVSPTFVYRVTESVTNGEGVEDSNNYDILLVLMSQVQGVLDRANEVTDRVESLETEMSTNEIVRGSNEIERKANEVTRLTNEVMRESQEEHRQAVFTEKIGEINVLTQGIRNDLDNKVQEVDTQLTKFTDTFNEKVAMVDNKIVEVDATIADTLVKLDTDVETTINTKFDGKMVEVIEHIDTTLNQKTTEKFLEVDYTLHQKLAENSNKVDDKVLEASLTIATATDKIKEMTTTIDTNVKKVNDKIDEVNITKTQLVNDVNAKIVEIDTAKTDLTTSIGDKMTEFEERFSSLESANPTGELTQSRISVDGVIHETLSKRLEYDYGKKANKKDVYTRVEIDGKIDGITSVDDANVSLESTWSSQKISGELVKKETIEGSQAKVTQAIQESKTYTDAQLAELIGQSPELLDTLEELSSALGNDPNFATTIAQQIAQKADKEDVYSRDEIDVIVSASTSINDETVSKISTWSSSKTSGELDKKVNKVTGKDLSTNDFTTPLKQKLEGLNNYVHPNDANTRHVTDAQIASWTSKSNGDHTHNQYSLNTHKHSYSELNDLPNIPSKVSQLQNDTGFITRSDVHTHPNKEVLDNITQIKIEEWNKKSNFSGNYNDLVGKPVVDVNKEYVDSQLATKANKNDVYTKEEVNQEISTAMDSLPTNISFNKLILASEWAKDADGSYYHEVAHNLGTERVIPTAMDTVTKEGLLIGYKIVDKARVLVKLLEPMEIFATIVNGDCEVQASAESTTKKNLAFDISINMEEWTMENGLATVVVTHRLFTENILLTAVDRDTKESIKTAYKIIDDTKVKVSILNPMNVHLSVLNCEKEFIHLTKESEISDDAVSHGSTWSSIKIQKEIEKAITTHNHNSLYYGREEVDVLVEPVDNEFIDGLFTSSSVRINGVKYYTADEIDAKFSKLIDMINKMRGDCNESIK